MPPLLSLSTPALLTTSLTNLSSARHRPPSLTAEREEGWTEVWGGKSHDIRTKNKSDGSKSGAVDPPRYVTVLNEDCDIIGQSTESNGDSTMVKLTQWRVAWYEQIILRMCHIPHTVENSSYAARECTGALPCLLDLSDCSDGSSHSSRKEEYLSRLDGPVYIGRNQPGGLGSYFFHQLCQSGGSARNNITGDNNGTATSDELHPSWFISSGSHIVDYLRVKHSKVMNESILFAEHSHQQQQQSNSYSSDIMAYETLIQDKLNYILLSLRYGNDPAWEGVYKQQCIRAALDPNDTNNTNSSTTPKEGQKRKWRFFPLMAWYQTYSERALALSNLLPLNYTTMIKGGLALDLFRYNDYRTANNKKDETSATTSDASVHQHHPYSSMVSSYGGIGGGNSGSVNVYRAMEYADMYYTSLEQKMGENPTYFLGTSLPSHIDALLFSHLAEALCDVYLILVLAKHSRLIRYFQWMYDQYFGEKYDGANLEWVKWNNCSNALNAFNQIPEAAALQMKGLGGTEGGDGGMTHAISLMQQLAIHCNELDEAMRDAAALRLKGGRERVVLEKQHRPIGSTLYQWLMGGEVKFWGLKRTKKSKSVGINKPHDTTSSGEGEEQKDSEDAKKEMWEKQMEEAKRARRHGDELWVSGVVVTFVGVLLLSYSKGKK